MFSGQISGIHRVFLLLLVLVFALGVVGSAEAARKKKKKDEKDKGKNFTVTTQMHKRLSASHEALEAEQYKEAAAILKELEKRAKRLTPYERALVFQMLGMTEASQEKYKEALVYFEKCLLEDALPNGAIVSTRYTIAQLYMATDEFEKAVKTLEKWFKEVETPNANAYYLLAAAYYQLDQIKKAIVPAEKAIEVAKKPKPPWLQLLVGLYYETKQYPKAVKPLETLIMIDPKKAYWTQLSSLYAHLEQEEKSLAVMQLAYAQDYLVKNSDLRALAQLYLYHSLPYRAGLVLEKAKEDGFIEENATYWEMLANSWLLARELDRALGPLQTGAVEKGDLNDESTTHLLLAISHYHQKQYQTSIRHLKVARRSETESVQKSASQWLLLVDRDVQALRDSQFEEEPPVEKAVEEEPAPQPDQAAQPDEAPQGEEISQAP